MSIFFWKKIYSGLANSRNIRTFLNNHISMYRQIVLYNYIVTRGGGEVAVFRLEELEVLLDTVVFTD